MKSKNFIIAVVCTMLGLINTFRLEQIRWIHVEMEKEYLLVNIPEFELHIYENSKEAWKTNVVVGQTA